MYDMINIFEAFLPHLLRYPNPSDPLNGEAAALMLRDPKGYDAKVRGRHALTYTLLGDVAAPVLSCSLLTVFPRVCPTLRKQRSSRASRC